MVPSCSCSGLPLSPSRVFSPALVPLSQGCISKYLPFCVVLSGFSGGSCSDIRRGGGGCFLFALRSVCSLCFVLRGVCIAFLSSAFTLLSGRVRYSFGSQPSLVVVYYSPGSFFTRWASFTSRLFIGSLASSLCLSSLFVVTFGSSEVFYSSCLIFALLCCVFIYSASLSFTAVGLHLRRFRGSGFHHWFFLIFYAFTSVRR